MEEAGFIKTHPTFNNLYEFKTKAAHDPQVCEKWKGNSVMVGLLNNIQVFLCL